MRSSRIRLLTALFAASFLSIAACSDDDDRDNPSGATGAGGQGGAGGGAPASGIQVRFELPASGAPDFLAVPFPTDLYRDATGVVTDIPGLDGYVELGSEYFVAGMAGQDGFGAIAGAIFALDDENGEAPTLDPGTFPADEQASLGDDASAMLVDLDAAGGEEPRLPVRVAYQDDRDIDGKLRPLLVVYPGRGTVLRPGRRYAAVVTTGMATRAGDPVSPSATFAAIADGSHRETEAEKLYGDAVDEVAELVPALADKKKIAAIALYTTSTTRKELVDLRAELGVMPPPSLSWDPAQLAPMGSGLFANAPLPAGFTATLDAWLGTPDDLMPPGSGDDPANDLATGKAHDALAAVGTAVFEAPNLLIDAGSYDDATHATFARDAGGTPIVNPDKPTSKVWVTIALPQGAVPATGFPVVIVQHGLGGHRGYLLSIANTFAKRGWATVAIESVTFGARSASPAPEDAVSGFPWSATSGYDGPDGFVDEPAGPTAFFGVLRNLGALRDQMRQSILDLGTLVDVLRGAPDLGPLAQAVSGATLDGSRIAYLGNSLGGIMGALHAAIDPHVSTYVLNVAGGGLPTELATGPIIAGQIRFAAMGNFGTGKATFVPGHPILQIMQHIVDPGDPLAYAHHLVREPAVLAGDANPKKNVLQIEVLWDEWVSNESNEALAFAAGLPMAEPAVGPKSGLSFPMAAPDGTGAIAGVPFPDVTAVLVQSGPATHGANLHDRQGEHGYEYPWPRWEEADPFPQLPDEIALAQPYLAMQATVVEFIGSAFAGAGPPVVKGFPEPKDDFDGDGALDADDADPNDPAKQ